MKKSPILILDISNLAFRMGHAHENLEGPDGSPTGAVYGVMKELEKLCGRYRPAYVMCCLDAGHAFRSEIFPGYKDRDRGDEEFYRAILDQIEELKELFRILPFRTVRVQGEEADDLMAHFTRVKYFKKYPKIIVSGDKDMLQLLSKKVSVLMPRGLITLKNFDEFFPVPQERWLDFSVLRGDRSDTIPGVGGIGETYGKEIVEKYDTLENAIASDGEGLSTRARNLLVKIGEAWDIVERNRKLMDLKYRRLKLKADNVTVGEWDKKAYKKFCRRRGFASLLMRLALFTKAMRKLENEN